MREYSGGGAERALSAGERQRGGLDKLRMIDKVRLRSHRDIKAPANPPHRTEDIDTATYEQSQRFSGRVAPRRAVVLVRLTMAN